MCSLVDQVAEPKETQLCSLEPHPAGSAVLSVPEPVVEVSCILMTLSGLHARMEVWLLRALALLIPVIDQYAPHCTGSIMQVLWLWYC